MKKGLVKSLAIDLSFIQTMRLGLQIVTRCFHPSTTSRDLPILKVTRNLVKEKVMIHRVSALAPIDIQYYRIRPASTFLFKNAIDYC